MILSQGVKADRRSYFPEIRSKKRSMGVKGAEFGDILSAKEQKKEHGSHMGAIYRAREPKRSVGATFQR